MFKSLFKKRVTLLSPLRDNRFFAVVAILVAFSILAFFVNSVIGFVFLLLVVSVFLYRLLFARLRLKDGDVVLFFGLPGSGKSMFLSKVGDDNADRLIGVNDEFSHYLGTDFIYSRDDLGHYRFGDEPSLLLFDEASLNGFDNRDFSVNFADPATLMFLKKIRHFRSAICFSNQGYDELDKKIRSGLVNKTYYVENLGLFSRASLMIKDISISDVDGQVIEGYRFPTFFERLLDPQTVLYCLHSKQGKRYASVNVPHLPLFPFLHS